jgi:putative transposase
VENYDEIGIETLSVVGMHEDSNEGFSRSLSDTSLHKFLLMIEYKQREYGKEVKKVARFEPTTKVCSNCGNVQYVARSERVFKCKACGFKMDRDLNASIVILKKAVGVEAAQRTFGLDDLHPNVDAEVLSCV